MKKLIYHICFISLLLNSAISTETLENKNLSPNNDLVHSPNIAPCPITCDLKGLVKKQYNKLFVEQKNQNCIKQSFHFTNEGKTWKAVVKDVGPWLNPQTINESKLIYHFNERRDWCLVDFSIEKEIESESVRAIKYSQLILVLDLTR